MYGTGLVSVVSGPAVPSSHLESGDALELHHLQHLLGLSINLDDVLKEDKMYYNMYVSTERVIVSKPLNISTILRCKWAGPADYALAPLQKENSNGNCTEDS